MYTIALACFEHSNLLKVNDLKNGNKSCPQVLVRKSAAESEWRDLHETRKNSTTSFLTATTLIYAIGAGITAAAGTRLALQLILSKGFKLYSFQ